MTKSSAFRDEVRDHLKSKAPAARTIDEVMGEMGLTDRDKVGNALSSLADWEPGVFRVEGKRGVYRFDKDADPETLWPEGALNRTRYLIARALVEMGGEAKDPHGRATSHLAERLGIEMGTSQATNVTNLVKVMERDGDLVREVNGKRTYRIAITPEAVERWFLHNVQKEVRRAARAEAKAAREAEQEPPAAPAAVADETELRAGAAAAAAVDDEAAARHPSSGNGIGHPPIAPDRPALPLPPGAIPVNPAVATQASIEAGDLLRAIVTVLGDGVETAKQRHDDQMARRLGTMHEHAEKLQREVERLQKRDRELSDLLAAVKVEARGLREQLQAAHLNVQRLTQGANAIEGEVHRHIREVDRQMREVPRSPALTG